MSAGSFPTISPSEPWRLRPEGSKLLRGRPPVFVSALTATFGTLGILVTLKMIGRFADAGLPCTFSRVDLTELRRA